jgi:uncharacterized protein YndB with AHSA1/START domain
MSEVRQQVLIDAPLARVWELVGDPARHPAWWPRVVEVRGERFDEGDNYAQVTRAPAGRIETTMIIERLKDMRQIHMRCTKTGTYAHWLMTEAQGGTFVDVELGMDPIGTRMRIFDATFGRLYFRRWMEQSLEALEEAVNSTGKAQAKG